MNGGGRKDTLKGGDEQTHEQRCPNGHIKRGDELTHEQNLLNRQTQRYSNILAIKVILDFFDRYTAGH